MPTVGVTMKKTEQHSVALLCPERPLRNEPEIRGRVHPLTSAYSFRGSTFRLAPLSLSSPPPHQPSASVIPE
jgi:hypothetical protein